MNTYEVTITKNGEPHTKPATLIEGDSFIFETPNSIFSGKYQIFKWKLERADRAIENLKKKIQKLEEEKQNFLEHLSSEKMLEELTRREFENMDDRNLV